MSTLYNIYNRVIAIMMTEPETRNSDSLLISRVDAEINPKAAALPYFEVMENRKKYGLPNCESIRRARQKAQATHPELLGNRKVKKHREELEEEYKAFARDKS